MNRRREQRIRIVSIGLSIIIILGIVYYFGVYKVTEKMWKQYDIEELEDELLLYKVKRNKLNTMKEEIEVHKEKNIGVMKPYNNLQKEMIELNKIFEHVSDYQFYFDDPTSDGKVVRRGITITFHASSYQSAKKIIKELYQFPYKSKLHKISINDTSSDSGIRKTKDVDVSLEITVYESITENSNVAGLQKYESQDENKDDSEDES